VTIRQMGFFDMALAVVRWSLLRNEGGLRGRSSAGAAMLSCR
jgi:hypothetical protein